MAITRERKEELVAGYSERLSRTDGFIVAEYRKMTVAQVSELRRRLREAEGTYVVTKNTLFAIALRENGWPVPDELLVGPTGVIFGNGNLPKVAKVVQKYVGEFPDNLIFRGGAMGPTLFGENDLETVTSLPTMDEIRAQIAGLIVTPASQLAGLLQAATSQIVNVLQAYEDDRNKGEAA